MLTFANCSTTWIYVYICSLLYIKKSAFVLFLGNRPKKRVLCWPGKQKQFLKSALWPYIFHNELKLFMRKKFYLFCTYRTRAIIIHFPFKFSLEHFFPHLLEKAFKSTILKTIQDRLDIYLTRNPASRASKRARLVSMYIAVAIRPRVLLIQWPRKSLYFSYLRS